MHTKEKAIEQMCFQQTGIYISSFGLTGVAGMTAWSEKAWIWQYKGIPSTLGTPQSLMS